VSDRDEFDQALDAFMGTGPDSYLAEVNRILDQANLKLGTAVQDGEEPPDGIWEVYDEMMAPDFLLSAPDGCVIELDGRCAHNFVSPVRGAGMV
jgi:hypothetical protein